MKIEAAVVPEKEDKYQITEVELRDEIKANDVLVKIVASGLCRSDFSKRTTDLGSFPTIVGHEGSGIVQEVGNQVTDVEPGDHVVLSYAYCNECEACLSGHPSSCEKWVEYNSSGTNLEGETVFSNSELGEIKSMYNQSSLATYSLTDETNVVKVDKDVDLRLLGPLSCGFTTGSGAVLNTLKPDAGESLAVFGTGALGFAAVMSAKIAGAHPIIAIDINDERLELAKQLGATHTFNNENDDPKEFINELTDDGGVDYAVDTSGVEGVMQDALNSLSSHGEFAPLAVGGDLSFNPYEELIQGNKKMVGSLMGDTIPKLHINKLVEFYKNGKFPFDKLTKFFDFEDVNEAEASSLSGDVVKPIVVMDKEYNPENY